MTFLPRPELGQVPIIPGRAAALNPLANRWGRGAFSRREVESLARRYAKKRPVPFDRRTRGTGRIFASRPPRENRPRASENAPRPRPPENLAAHNPHTNSAFQAAGSIIAETPTIHARTKTMLTIETVAAFLDHFAPARLAEDWDNVGLLVGDRRRTVRRVMTCLTITPASAAEAIEREADLIVSHHPLPFAALKRLTTDTTVGRLLLDLIAAQVGVYSPHTAFDSAAEGINQRLSAGLGLRGILPLVPHEEGQGTGRYGWLGEPVGLGQLAQRVKEFLSITGLQMVGTRGATRSAWWPSPAARRASCSTRPAAPVAMPWSSARPGSTPAWKPRRRASACCCRGTSPASGSPSWNWQESWLGNSPISRSGPAARSGIRFGGCRVVGG